VQKQICAHELLNKTAGARLKAALACTRSKSCRSLVGSLVQQM